MDVVLFNSVESFLEPLSPQEVAKVVRTIELLEEFGNDLGMPHSKHLKDGLLELRIRGKREIRVLYCFHKQQSYLLHAFIKKTQKTPEKELSIARALKNSLQ